jgi:hypothetical protein
MTDAVRARARLLQAPTSVRVTHLDWLRIIVVGMLIPFHTAMTFAPYAWYVRNAQLNLATQALVQVMDKYQMELLFFIAGVATWHSFGVRKWGQYLRERLARLVVPAVVAMLVIVPPCYYFAARFSDRLFSLTYTGWWDWYVKYWLKHMTPFSGLWGATTNAGALWFLWNLVLYTFALSPLFVLIYRKGRKGLIPALVRFFEKPGALLLLAVPIAAVIIMMPWKLTVGGESYRIIGWTITGDFQVLYYVLFFVYGFFIYADARFQKGIDRTGPIALVLAVVTMTLFMLLVFPVWNKAALSSFWYRFRGEPFTTGYYLSQGLYAVTSWSWVLSILYLARRFLNTAGRFVSWGNDAVLPVYIVHSTFIAVLSFYIVGWKADVLPKYVLIVALTYLGSIALVQLAKTNNLTRALMGMRLKKMSAAQQRGNPR